MMFWIRWVIFMPIWVPVFVLSLIICTLLSDCSEARCVHINAFAGVFKYLVDWEYDPYA